MGYPFILRDNLIRQYIENLPSKKKEKALTDQEKLKNKCSSS